VTYTINYTFPDFVGTRLRTLVNGQLYTVNDTAEPTLYAIQQDPTWTPPSTEQRNLLTIPDQYNGENVRIVVSVVGGATHPFHLHGHGFQVVASGLGSFNDTALAQVNSVNLRDVIVRDTVIVQGGGWIVIQYVFPRSRTMCNLYLRVGVFPAGLRPTIRAFGLCIVTLVS
jgi:FtsP/CotA-like multicopper oxidase with cupredoxin domain